MNIQSQYTNKVVNGVNYVWLQYHGWQTAKPASEFNRGDIMVWNNGHTSLFLEVVKETKAFITIREVCADIWGNWENAKVYERKFKKSRLIATSNEVSGKNYNNNVLESAMQMQAIVI